MGCHGKARAEFQEDKTPILPIPRSLKMPCRDLPRGQALPTPLPGCLQWAPHPPMGRAPKGCP